MSYSITLHQSRAPPLFLHMNNIFTCSLSLFQHSLVFLPLVTFLHFVPFSQFHSLFPYPSIISPLPSLFLSVTTLSVFILNVLWHFLLFFSHNLTLFLLCLLRLPPRLLRSLAPSLASPSFTPSFHPSLLSFFLTSLPLSFPPSCLLFSFPPPSPALPSLSSLFFCLSQSLHLSLKPTTLSWPHLLC